MRELVREAGEFAQLAALNSAARIHAEEYDQ